MKMEEGTSRRRLIVWRENRVAAPLVSAERCQMGVDGSMAWRAQHRAEVPGRHRAHKAGPEKSGGYTAAAKTERQYVRLLIKKCRAQFRRIETL